MKAITKPTAAPGFKLADVPIPPCGPDEVRIRVTLASICGTDAHITQWDEWSASRIKPPMVYGHEFCGTIETCGQNVTHLAPGDYVSAEMHINCGVCRACRTGKAHICEAVKIAGIDQDGCFAEFVVLPAKQVIQIPACIPPETGACLDALGNAVHTVSKGNVSGKSVLITGCGPIGLFAICVAHALGASQVFASDISPYRLDLARKVGATAALDAASVDLPQFLQSQTDGRGVDVVLEMSGNPRALDSGFSAMAPGGTMVMLGIPKGPVTLDITNHIIFKEAIVRGVNGREMYQTWYLMLNLLSSGKLKIDDIITHRFPLAQFDDAMALVLSGNSGKVLIAP